MERAEGCVKDAASREGIFSLPRYIYRRASVERFLLSVMCSSSSSSHATLPVEWLRVVPATRDGILTLRVTEEVFLSLLFEAYINELDKFRKKGDTWMKVFSLVG